MSDTQRKDRAVTIIAEAEAWAEDNAWRFPPGYDEQTPEVKHAMAMAYKAGVLAERKRNAAM